MAFVIPYFFNLVTNQFDRKIKCIKSNNAKELAFTEFLNQQGVLHQFSCVDRPQQNSIVERKHQQLLNVARALYFESRISLHNWSGCVLTTTLLINRTPSPLLGNKSPYELLYQNVVDYSSFRVFGCLTFVSTLPVHRTKFDPRARLCIFIRYPNGVKGYKLLDVQTKQILISRDVVFHEEIFPFHSIVSSDDLHPFANVVLPISPSGSFSDCPQN